MILGGGGLCQRKLTGGLGKKARVVVSQWVPTFKEAVPPPTPRVDPRKEMG